MDFMSQIVPAIIILIANLLSGRHSSLRWETVTAVFGWTAVISMMAWIILYNLPSDNPFTFYVAQLAGFSLVTALSRDYEKLLKPLFPWNR